MWDENNVKKTVHTFQQSFLINRNGYEINKLNSFKSVFKGIKNAVNRFINSQHLVTRIPMRSKHRDQTDGNSWVT